MIGRRALLAVAAMSAVTGATSACAGDRPLGPVRLGSGRVGGMFYDFARLFADVAAETNAVLIDPVVTSGSCENLALLARGELDAALALADSVDKSHAGVSAIGRLYESYIQLAVRVESSIRSVNDLRGARVDLGVVGSGAAMTAERAIRAAGLDPVRDMIVSHRQLVEANKALRSGALDAIVWGGGVPTPGTGIPERLRLLELGGLVPVMQDRFGYFYGEATIPADAYPGAKAVSTIGVPNLLVVAPNLPNATATALTELLLDNADDLMPRQAVGFQFLNRRWLIGTGDVPLHPAAAAVYRGRHE